MRTCYLFLVCLLAASAALAASDKGYDQVEDVVYLQAHGVAFVMDVFTPVGASNGLGIVEFNWTLEGEEVEI